MKDRMRADLTDPFALSSELFVGAQDRSDEGSEDEPRQRTV